MFSNTFLLLSKTVREIKAFVCFVTVFADLVTIGYLIYATFSGSGILPLNIALACVCLLHLIFYIATYNSKDKGVKQARGVVFDITRRSKLIIKTVTLAVNIYGIYISAQSADAIAIILATLSIIMWILQLLFEIVYSFVKHKLELLKASLSADLVSVKEKLSAPIHMAQDIASAVGGDVREFAKTTVEGMKNAGRGISSAASAIGSLFKRKDKSKLEAPSDDSRETINK